MISIVRDDDDGEEQDMLTVTETFYLPFNISSCPLILGPRNGLFCISGSHDVEDCAIWNPATRELKVLPKSPRAMEFPDWCETTFHEIGFGFDPKTNDYKVIRFVEYCFNRSVDSVHQVELYSLKTDSWRLIPAIEGKVYPRFNDHDIYLDGVRYWWALRETLDDQSIVSFDMADEVFEKLPLPLPYNNYDIKTCSFLTVLNRSLSVIGLPADGLETCFDIWVMIEHGISKSWVKQRTIGPISGFDSPIDFWKHDGWFSVDPEGYLILYDTNTQRVIKKLRLNWRDYSLQVISYEESLVPINGGHVQHEYSVLEQHGLEILENEERTRNA